MIGKVTVTAGVVLLAASAGVGSAHAEDQNCYVTVGSTVCVASDDPANAQLALDEAEYAEAYNPDVTITLPPANDDPPMDLGDVQPMEPGLLDGVSDLAPGETTPAPAEVFTPAPATEAPPAVQPESVPFVPHDPVTVVIELPKANSKH